MQRASRRPTRRILCVLLLLAMFVAGCSAAEPAASTASTAPVATASSATVAPSATSEPTKTPTPPPPTAPPVAPSSLIVWHSFGEGTPELAALNALLDTARSTLATTTIEARSLPGDAITTRFEVELAAGGGPDLLIASNDYLLRQASAGLLRPLDSDIAAQRESYAPNALAALTVDGKLYGVPLSRSTTALYYNRAKMAAPPQSTQQLLDAVRGGTKLILIRSTFFSNGFLGAFGGRLLDDGGRCVADAGGVADALAFLRELKSAGAQFVTDGAEAEERFRSGEFDLTVGGSWLLQSYRAALTDQLGVAPVPAGPAGPATPFIGATGVYVNASSERAADATQLALLLADEPSQTAWAEQTGQLPARSTVPIADEALGGLAAAALTGVAWPQRPELAAVWEPFDAALAEVLDANADPVAAVQTACAAVNAENGK